MYLSISSEKWRPFYPGGDELNNTVIRGPYVWDVGLVHGIVLFYPTMLRIYQNMSEIGAGFDDTNDERVKRLLKYMMKFTLVSFPLFHPIC